MPTAMVDSNVIIAASSTRDVDHDVALDILTGIDVGDLPTCRVSNYVVAEVLNFVHARHRHGLAVDLYDRLSRSAGIEIVQATKRDYHRAVDAFCEHDSLSFVDATIVAHMRRAEITTLYSFDDDFDRFDGVMRLTVPENPFS